jgi:hypothetical protein
VLYGRDTEAHNELSKFLRALGLKEIQFQQVADEMGANPFIGEIVLNAMQRADLVIALFTPDEQAALFDPQTGKCDESRWQARPNVIFEAGIAFGNPQKELVLATLGADVRLFSDLHGKHIIDLGKDDGKLSLFKRLNNILKAGWTRCPRAGDFKSCLRHRWEFYDELSDLQAALSSIMVGPKSKTSVLETIRRVIKAHPDATWDRRSSRSFVKAMNGIFDDSITDEAYWWLVVNGFFIFEDIDNWWDEEDHWEDSSEYAYLSPRGLALLKRLKVEHLRNARDRAQSGGRARKRR